MCANVYLCVCLSVCPCTCVRTEVTVASRTGRVARVVPPATPPAVPGAPSPAPPPTGTVLVRVLHDYSPRSPDELELHMGQLIKVTKKEDDGWWHGETDGGAVGVFPSNFVQELGPA